MDSVEKNSQVITPRVQVVIFDGGLNCNGLAVGVVPVVVGDPEGCSDVIVFFIPSGDVKGMAPFPEDD